MKIVIRTYFLTIIACLVFPTNMAGQKTMDFLYTGVEYSYGGILRHSKELPGIGSKRINGFTITLGQLHTSKEKWEQCFCYPLLGTGLAAYDFGDTKVLGKSINPFLYAAPYINPKGKFRVIPRGGAGFSYVSKTFDAEKNPENIFLWVWA